ncbi:DUF6602 domain-containing protein [Vibrio parahaemolyticus]|uniref:DUF6602 domain-containing protein n=1 Tax=Vibrio parahaemolyticus TaxID=670 RepID=UPI0004455F6A|nr:DUF6602 domain-containing protein [Vibrio parahaemolyticus]ELK5320570.1 hypothetical protein [Vibrio vulnificus]ELY2121195.1 hypothetical protein [Vibrio parahaemolyticus]ETZ12391.1 hypothetical protein AJ90_25890 [Vibrio parahaemolyticus M0605]TOI04879.1 hypothetical protein CGI68_24495 [Vibrio parahaemolyticus]
MKKDIIRSDDLTDDLPLSQIMKKVNKRFNEKLFQGRENGRLIEHNLEYGLGAENILRSLLTEVLPEKYGIGKGKIVTEEGELSSHLDVIIYDKINYPKWFVDENKNLILPFESVYAVIEVKAKTSSSVLQKAFDGLQTVSHLDIRQEIRSINDYVDLRPPMLVIFSFEDDRPLETIKDNFCRLSDEYNRSWSFNRYSNKSPGSSDDNGYHYLVDGIYILGKGAVYPMLNGDISIGYYGENTVGMFISGLISSLRLIPPSDFHAESYINWLGSGAVERYKR